MSVAIGIARKLAAIFVLGSFELSLAQVLARGPIVSIDIINPGSGCTATPDVTISGDGQGAHAVAWLQPTVVESLEVLSGGSNHNPGINPADGAPYTQVIVQGHNDGPGSIVAHPVITHGVITSIPKQNFLTTPGWVWTPVISVIDYTGAGSGSHIWAHLRPTGVQRIDVVGNGGASYSQASVAISGKGCSGVVAKANIADAGTLPSWWSHQNWFPNVNPVIGWQTQGGYFPTNIPTSILNATSPRGGSGHNAVWSKGDIELSARRFKITHANAPELRFARAPHGDCNCYRIGDKISSIFFGYTWFSNMVIDPNSPFPSSLQLGNGDSKIALFYQGLSVGTGAYPGPGGLSAMDIQGHSTADSRDVGTGAIVTVGGLGVAKSAHFGADFAVLGQGWKPGGGSWAGISDRRLKKEIAPIEGALDRLVRLQPVTYEWRNPSLHARDRRASGFIAQEVGEVFPEFVSQAKCQGADCELTGGENINTLSLTNGFKAFLVGAIQELSSRISSLLSSLEQNEKRITSQYVDAKVLKASRVCFGKTCLDEQKLRQMSISESSVSRRGE